MAKLSRSISYFLMLIVVINAGALSLVVVNFNLNQEYFATVLCENKAQPELNCLGSCCLKRMMKKAAQESNEDQELQVPSICLEYTSHLSAISLPDPSVRISQTWNLPITDGKPIPYVLATFHPPQVG